MTAKLRTARLFVLLALAGALLFIAGLSPFPVQAVSSNVVIGEFRVRGPQGGNDEFVELYNLSTAPVNIGGWLLKGSNSSGYTSTRATITAGATLGPKCHYLLTNAGSSGYSGSVSGDQTYTTGITDDGGIALLDSTSTMIDQVGMSNGSAYKEGTPLASLGTSNLNRGYERKPGGALGSGTDTDNNSTDFQLISPSDPQNLASPCIGSADAAPAVLSTTPANKASNVALDANVSVTFGEPVNVSGNWYNVSCLASGTHTAAVTGGPTTFTLDPSPDFAYGETCTVTVLASGVTDQDTNDPPDNMAGNYRWTFTTLPLAAPIHDIQGANHLSPLQARIVSTHGTVTGLRTAGSTRGFYVQDPNPDEDVRTSEGIFVFTGSSSNPGALVAVGDSVTVTGSVSEFRAAATSLTITEITSPSIAVLAHGEALPSPVLVGAGGRIPPAVTVEDDAVGGNVEDPGSVFDPASDGMDFWESLEGMRALLNSPLAVGPTVRFGGATPNREIAVVGDQGAKASVRTPRGGLVIRSNDLNPERIILNDMIAGVSPLPLVNVRDSFPGAVIGILDYSYGNYKLEVTQLPEPASGGLVPETIGQAGASQLAVATFNVENLAPSDPPDKFSRLANLIVQNLRAADLLAIEEIQDNSGATDDHIVDATTTYNMLIAAIQAAGGPAYQFRQIDPVNNADGGAPGGNIRQGFLYRTGRGLAFVDRPGGTSTGATTVVAGPAGPQLTYSPGRIDPLNAAFVDSRKPLAGEFTFNGHHLFVIANHFNSKSGDQPLFGRYQPPAFSSEVQRVQQATVVRNFVQSIVDLDPQAEVIVLGDLNDFQFSAPLVTLKGTVLKDLIETLPEKERYTYVYDGNSETLDHILLSNALASRPYVYKVVHVNSEFWDQASDHEPQAVHLNFAPPK